eukprot:129896-Pyramimonas_sp.AAC.1
MVHPPDPERHILKLRQGEQRDAPEVLVAVWHERIMATSSAPPRVGRRRAVGHPTPRPRSSPGPTRTGEGPRPTRAPR